jgi:hypothetical protein
VSRCRASEVSPAAFPEMRIVFAGFEYLYRKNGGVVRVVPIERYRLTRTEGTDPITRAAQLRLIEPDPVRKFAGPSKCVACWRSGAPRASITPSNSRILGPSSPRP